MRGVKEEVYARLRSGMEALFADKSELFLVEGLGGQIPRWGTRGGAPRQLRACAARGRECARPRCLAVRHCPGAPGCHGRSLPSSSASPRRCACPGPACLPAGDPQGGWCLPAYLPACVPQDGGIAAWSEQSKLPSAPMAADPPGPLCLSGCRSPRCLRMSSATSQRRSPRGIHRPWRPLAPIVRDALPVAYGVLGIQIFHVSARVHRLLLGPWAGSALDSDGRSGAAEG